MSLSPVYERPKVSSLRAGRQPSEPNIRPGLAALQSKLFQAKRERGMEQTQQEREQHQKQRKWKAVSKQHEKLVVTILADLMSTKASQASSQQDLASPPPPSAAKPEKAMECSDVAARPDPLEEEEDADDSFFDRKGCNCARADQPPVWPSYTGREPPTKALKRRVEAVSSQMGVVVPEPSTKARRRCSMVISHERAGSE